MTKENIIETFSIHASNHDFIMLPLHLSQGCRAIHSLPQALQPANVGEAGNRNLKPRALRVDDGKDAKTMMQALLVAMIWWKIKSLKMERHSFATELSDLPRLSRWTLKEFNLFTALASLSRLVWSQHPRACRPAGCQVLKYSAKAFPAPHTRSAPWKCGCGQGMYPVLFCDILMVWLVSAKALSDQTWDTLWCLDGA